MKKTLLGITLLTAAIFGCSAASGDNNQNQSPLTNKAFVQQTPVKKSMTKQETIYGIDYQGHKLSIQVMSNGCTAAKSFKQVWQDNHLILERIKADFCRRRPHKKWLVFELPRAFSQLTVINKLAS